MIVDTRSGIALENFLSENFVFRRLQIHEFFDNKNAPILWTARNDSEYLAQVDHTPDSCTLLDDRFFSNWAKFNNEGLNLIYDELLYRQIWSRAKIRLKAIEVKSTIKYLVKETNVTKTIAFNPVLKQLIAEGRHHVKHTKPLKYGDPLRTNIKAKKRDSLYVCKDEKPPYIANPCYVLATSGNNTYRIMAFTSLNAKFEETKAKKINGWCFVTVDANELGRTPEEAVLQVRS